VTYIAVGGATMFTFSDSLLASGVAVCLSVLDLSPATHTRQDDHSRCICVTQDK
jgi:hypothetical protein